MACYLVSTPAPVLNMLVTLDMCLMRWPWYQVQNVVTDTLVTIMTDLCHQLGLFLAATIPQIGILKIVGNKNKENDLKSMGGPSQELIGYLVVLSPSFSL